MTANPDTNGPVLGTVVIPCTARDLLAIERIFRLWSRAGFAPARSAPPPVLMIVVNMADDALLDDIRALYHAHPRLARHFRDMVAVSAGLTGDADLYVRKQPKPMGRYGNKAGPNFMFQKAMHFAAPYGGYALQIELDCLPIGSAWIDRTLEVIARNQGAWVIGSAYAGKVKLDPKVQFHLNGNAIYKAGDPRFITFLDEIWIRRILDHIEEDPNLAYDCWWAFEMSRASSAERNVSWKLWQRYDRMFRNDPFLVNLRVGYEDIGDFLSAYDHFAGLRAAPPVFFHGQAIGQLIEQLCLAPERDLLEVIASPPVAVTSSDTTRVILGKGFHPLAHLRHGPDGCRSVWTSAEQTEFIPAILPGDLCLPFRMEPRFRSSNTGLPDFTLVQEERPVSHKVRVSPDGGTGYLEVPRQEIELGVKLGLRCQNPLKQERSGAKRRLGVLFYEQGVIFETPPV